LLKQTLGGNFRGGFSRRVPVPWWIYVSGGASLWESVNGSSTEGLAYSGDKFYYLDGGTGGQAEVGQSSIPATEGESYYFAVWAKDASLSEVGVFDFVIRFYESTDDSGD